MVTRRAFTAVEALLALGVIALTAGLSVPMYRNYQIRSDLDLAVEQTIHGLNRAQLLSRSGEDDSTWGFQVEEGTIFQGEAYAIRDPSGDEVIPIPTTIVVYGITEVVFERVTGEPSPTGEIILEALNGQQRIITVSSNGSFTSSDIITPEYDEGGDTGSNTDGTQGGDTATATGGDTGETSSDTGGGSSSSAGSQGSSTGGDTGESGGSGGGSYGDTCEDRFTVAADGTLETTGSVNASFRALGSAITYGAGGPEVQVYADVSIDGGETWVDLFNGAEIDGGEQQTISSLYSDQQIVVRVNGRYGWLFNKTYESNDGSGHIEVLRNGDTPPAYEAFGEQAGLASFLNNIIDDNGNIEIGDYDAVLLVELGTLSTSSSDFQDAVILVQFDQEPGSCADASGPRYKVTFDRIENSGTGNAAPVTYVGVNGIAYAPGQWIPLTSNNEVIIDSGIVEDVPGMASERANGFVRMLLHGSHNGLSNKEIVDARITFENAEIVSIENDDDPNPSENPFDSIVNDGPGGDEAYTEAGNLTAVYKTRVTGSDDAIKIYWQEAVTSSSSSSSGGTQSSGGSTSSSGSQGSEGEGSSTSSSGESGGDTSGGGDLDDPTPDPCGAAYTLDNGRIILDEEADVTFQVVGTYATYGESGPEIQMRVSASTDAGSTWEALYGYRAVTGGETETYENLPSGSQIILRTEGRRSWLFRQTADSNDGTDRIIFLQRGDPDPGTAPYASPQVLKSFLRNMLQDRRISIGKRELLALVELQGTENTADYQDLALLIIIEKPASEGVCGAPSGGSSSSVATTSSSSSSTSSEGPEEEVAICHFPPGNANNYQTLTLGTSAVGAHLAHGDRMGECESDSDGDTVATGEDLCPNTYVPEPVPTEFMLFNRYALARNNSFIFVEGPRKKISNYTIDDTRGCSCEQLIDVAEGVREYHFGQFPRLLRNMRSLFPFYTNGARQFGCGRAILDMIKNY